MVKKNPATGATELGDHGSLDFWVTGKNCCSTSSSDFRCPGYDSAKARAGLRILRDDSLQLYRLAVQQAETQYGFLSTYPVFVEWVEDPVYVLEDITTKMVVGKNSMLT